MELLLDFNGSNLELSKFYLPHTFPQKLFLHTSRTCGALKNRESKGNITCFHQWVNNAFSNAYLQCEYFHVNTNVAIEHDSPG